MPKKSHSDDKERSARRKERLAAQLKSNLRKRKDQARARVDIKPDSRGLAEPAGDKDDA